jgi:DNA-binding beta-propeller fold protein YncE/mono/diheme cytochrome c family protein
MKRFLLLASVCSLVCAAQAAYLSPETISLTPDGQSLVIAEKRAGRVSVRNLDGTVRRSLSLTAPTQGFFGMGAELQTLPVTGACVAPDGTIFFTVENGNDGKLVREGGKSVITGNRPMAPIVSPDGRWVYVCNRFDANVQQYDAQTLKLVNSVKCVRETHGCALGKDGKLLFVINLLPDNATEPVQTVSAKVTVVDTETFTVKANLALPDGSTGVRGVTAAPDGLHVYVTHTQARYQLPTTQLERGWMNTAALSVFDGVTGAYINTVLLDDIDLGAANPWGVTVTPDNQSIVVTHAGSREVSVIERDALHRRLDDAAAGKKVTEVTSSADEVHNDLSFLTGIRRRFKFKADGPRGVVATNDRVYAVCHFADALIEVPFTEKRVVRAKVTPLNGTALADLKSDPVLRGEMLFNDGTKCFQNWQSCASCHPDARVDGLNWDLMNDSIGNPKQSKSLYLSGVTPPTMITGIRKDMKHCNRAGFRHIQFCAVPEEDTLCIDAYVMAMKAQVSPWARAEYAAAVARGKAIFDSPDKADCARCHKPELYFTASVDPNDGSKAPLYDLGLGTRDEKGQTFDVPSLNEVWRTAPYLYDGRAKTLREVLTVHNPEDYHGITQDLTEQELSDLEIYVLSL